MNNKGITFAGDSTEDEFISIVPGSGKLKKNDSRGDVQCTDPTTGEVYFVEVKKTTLNQVRPNKYNVLVSKDTDSGDWYVIPPHRIVALCLNRRGQHTPDPLQCVGLGKITSQRWERYKVKPGRLSDDVLLAYKLGQKHTKLRRLAESHKQDQEMGRLAYQDKLRSALS